VIPTPAEVGKSDGCETVKQSQLNTTRGVPTWNILEASDYSLLLERGLDMRDIWSDMLSSIYLAAVAALLVVENWPLVLRIE